jgi:hypothetical protein
MAISADFLVAIDSRAWTAETFRLERVMHGLADQLEELVDVSPVPEWLMGQVSEATESVRGTGQAIHEAVVNAMLAVVDVSQCSKETRRILEIQREYEALLQQRR